MNKVIEKIHSGVLPSQEDLVYLLSQKDFSEVFALADQVRCENHGDIINIRAILEFSNYCKRRCRYCGLNSENKNVFRYRMKPEEIVDISINAWKAGYQTIVLQSGEDPWYTDQILGNIIKKIKEQTEMAITLSCGELSKESYAYLRHCGADRYLLKHETADDGIYSSLHPCGTLKERLEALRNIKSLGYETGSGFMIGLPGQTLDTIAKDILTLYHIGLDMAGIGPFISHPDTTLGNMPNGSTELTKRAVALTRILMPKSNLPATTSLGVINSSEKDEIFSCGANIIMRKVTPQKYEEHYNIYPSEIKVKDIFEERKFLEEQIRNLGRIPI